MLVELAIRDFAIIDQVRVEFQPGFNVLTGETGAGKSILIDALGAVLGERVGPDVVRTGARAAWIEATFAIEPSAFPVLAGVLEEFGLDLDEPHVVLSREVQAGGRSVARVNGRTATVGLLNRIGGVLVDIHGQSDHLSLYQPDAQLLMLDRYTGLTEERERLATEVSQLKALQSRIREVTSGERERARRVDQLRFEVDEITAANLAPEEEEALAAERSVLANAERLALQAASVYALLAGDDESPDAGLPALAAVRQATGLMTDIAAVDPAIRELSERVNEALFLLEDIAAEARDYRDRLEANPERLKQVEDRLDELKSLKRKYGATIAEVLAYGEQAASELESLTGDSVDLDVLRERIEAQREAVGRLASELSAARTTASTRLAAAVEQAMAELNMGRAAFAVDIHHLPDADGVPLTGAGDSLVAVDATGIDRVTFMLAPNAGEALKPLARVASGGETARLMLALKSILSNVDQTPVLIFDEVDVGVGGRSGQVVGEKLWQLAAGHQVMVITHLPQIAAFGDAHFRIEKREQQGRAVSRIEPIADAERLDELAAMLDGTPVSEASRRNAAALLARVREWTDGARLVSEPTLQSA